MLKSETAVTPENNPGEEMQRIAIADLLGQQAEKSAAIIADGAKEVFAELPDAKGNFTLGTKEVRCVDEGVCHDGVHLAGSGALMPREELVATLAGLLNNGAIDGYTTHEGCAAHAASGIKEDAETFGRAIAAEVAQKTGKPFPYRFIRKDEMTRDPGLHHANVVWYAGAQFRVKSEQLPEGFIANRDLFGSHALEDAKLCVNIIKGDHGVFGPHGAGAETMDREIILIPVADAQNAELTAETLEQELQQIADELSTPELPVRVMSAVNAVKQ